LKKLVAILVIIVAFAFSAFNNAYFWGGLAEFAVLSTNNQSKFYIFCLNRVYSNIQCNDIKYVSYLEKDGTFLQKHKWIRISAVSGNINTAEIIQGELKKSLSSQTPDQFLPYYIKAAGVLGSQQSKNLLYEIGKNDEKFSPLERSLALSALFLLSGKNYGEEFGFKYVVPEEIRAAYGIVKRTAGSCRTAEEMIALDGLYRVSDY
jgi:hypothetical protein